MMEAAVTAVWLSGTIKVMAAVNSKPLMSVSLFFEESEFFTTRWALE